MPNVPGNVRVVRTDARRKTLSLEVRPSGEVWVRAPEGCDNARIQAMLVKRELWIAEQKAFFKRFDPRTPTRTWVPGESHMHLGRRYKLCVELGHAEGVRLRGSDLVVMSTHSDHKQPAHIEAAVHQWRHQQAKEVFSRLLMQCHRHYRFASLPLPTLRIQQLSKRWGSLSSNGSITLHTGLVQAPPACIDYVVFHELCHLVHANHSQAFFALLDEVCPQWVARKQLLETSLR